MTLDTFALPRFIREKAEDFFWTDFSTVKLHIDFRPLEYGAVAFAQGDNLHFVPGYFNPASKIGLKLLGHELVHVVQQRSGSCAAAPPQHQMLLDNAALEFEADVLAQAFLQYYSGDIGISRVCPAASDGAPTDSAVESLIQLKVWEPDVNPSIDDELFWHATTFESVTALYKSEKIDISLGNGWMGRGFYVTTAKSDYQKMMAFRNLQGNFQDERQRDNYGHPMYLLCMLVEDFWRMNGEIKDGYAQPSGKVDFIGIRWSGDYGTEEKTIKKPGPGSYRDRKYARMGAYQDEPIFQLGVKPVEPSSDDWHSSRYTAHYADEDADESTALKQRESVLNRLWSLAQSNNRGGSTNNSRLDLIVRMMGPRNAFKATLKELAFTNTGLGGKIHVVGAKAFAHRKMPLPKEADVESALEKNYIGRSIDFDDDKWVDMNWLEEQIKSQRPIA